MQPRLPSTPPAGCAQAATRLGLCQPPCMAAAHATSALAPTPPNRPDGARAEPPPVGPPKPRQPRAAHTPATHLSSSDTSSHRGRTDSSFMLEGLPEVGPSFGSLRFAMAAPPAGRTAGCQWWAGRWSQPAASSATPAARRHAVSERGPRRRHAPQAHAGACTQQQGRHKRLGRCPGPHATSMAGRTLPRASWQRMRRGGGAMGASA